MRLHILIFTAFIFTAARSFGQVKVWSVDDCINYAYEKNIQIRQARVSSYISRENLELARALRYPSLSGSARQNFAWSNQQGTGGSEVFRESDGTTLSLTSTTTLYNGLRLQNNRKMAEVNYEASNYNVEVIKESVSLNILNAYLQVLYAQEQVSNSLNQVASTEEQVRLASERYRLGQIANSDYLQVKSQLATENQTLATARSQLAIDRVTLLQLMELPDTVEFNLARPNFDSLVKVKRFPSATDVYNAALGFKPEVRSAELNKKSSEIAVEVAKAGLIPTLSLSTGVSTNYSSSVTTRDYSGQLSNNLSPTVGITASVPIYTNRQARTNINTARLNTDNADLNEENTKIVLRKAIEQACLDVTTSQIEFQSGMDAYEAAKESYDVATEKFRQGLMNSIDYLVQKTSLITAESNLLQAKYRLVFDDKILDFYMGKPLSF
ncbi:MAG TPA: TolC family protein [Bacteroidales bacterium]|nr:TolC family protein [Bacteroidales bacterium]